jgi:hypothetical protein
MQHACNVLHANGRGSPELGTWNRPKLQTHDILQQLNEIFQDGSPPCLPRGHDQRGCAFQATPGFCHGRRVSYRVPRTRACALLWQLRLHVQI